MEPTLDEALLTAYLDGELSPQDRQQLEQRLANEPELRRRLSLMEETWNCLNLLEQENADAEQIETTLQLAAVSVAALPFVVSKANRFRRGGLIFAGLLLLLVSFQFGKHSPLDDPSFRRMAERLEMYRTILDDDGLKFLQLLAVHRVFLPSLPEGVPPVAAYEYEPVPGNWMSSVFAGAAAGYHSGFDDAELYQLIHKNIQAYHQLPYERMEQVRKLHRDIETAPRSTELLLTLQNYYHWLKSLQPYERLELRKPKPLEEKAAEIIKLKTRLDQQSGESPFQPPSGIVSIEESKQLSETLAELPLARKERLLNNDPMQIINRLKRSAR